MLQTISPRQTHIVITSCTPWYVMFVIDMIILWQDLECQLRQGSCWPYHGQVRVVWWLDSIARSTQTHSDPLCRVETNSSNCLLYKQSLLFVFELQDSLLSSSTGMLTVMQRQTAVTAYLNSKQLLVFIFELQDSLLSSSTGETDRRAKKTAVTDYCVAKANSSNCLLKKWEVTAGRLCQTRQQAVTTYWKIDQLLLFDFSWQL